MCLLQLIDSVRVTTSFTVIVYTIPVESVVINGINLLPRILTYIRVILRLNIAIDSSIACNRVRVMDTLHQFSHHYSNTSFS